MISIGHPAYQDNSKNAYAKAANKTQAVNILMQRGCTRASARRAVDEAQAGSFATVRVRNSSEVIEVKVQSN